MVATIWPSIFTCALPRSGPMVETHARLVAGAAFDGLAVAPAVLDCATEPPNAVERLTPLQEPLKLDWKLLSVSGTVNEGMIENALRLPCLSTACTWNWY